MRLKAQQIPIRYLKVLQETKNVPTICANNICVLEQQYVVGQRDYWMDSPHDSCQFVKNINLINYKN